MGHLDFLLEGQGCAGVVVGLHPSTVSCHISQAVSFSSVLGGGLLNDITQNPGMLTAVSLCFILNSK